MSHDYRPCLQGWRVRTDMHRTVLKITLAEEPVFLQLGRLMTMLETSKKNAALSWRYSTCSPVLLGSTSHFQIMVTNDRPKSSIAFLTRLVRYSTSKDFSCFNISIKRQRLQINRSQAAVVNFKAAMKSQDGFLRILRLRK